MGELLSVSRFGYAAVAAGAFLEGETTMLLAGILAKLGFLQLKHVVTWSFVGTFSGDCCFFFVGKFFGRILIERYEFLRRRTAASQRIIHQYGKFILFMMRFLVGFRTITLILLGCANFRAARFLSLGLVSALVWSLVVPFIGYNFANVVYIFASDIRGYERTVIPLLAVIVIAAILLFRHVVKEKEEEQLDGN